MAAIKKDPDLHYDTPIVVLTHRPLFPLLPQWDWATRDGMTAVEALMPYRNVTVFYGHIHHEHHHRTGHIEHHAAKAVMFPLSPVGTAPDRSCATACRSRSSAGRRPPCQSR